ncbi:GNAT family N-acetyltransferase [Streptomyces hoynatensis]|uniref:GNAT family N-acetyltransferase n=1 Tax=Streptomyces hoynatensis TaxID=1141874 RepID=A0A3A9YP31_9ACTN|nr:GNAT family N-acetyltransferase [Streptomyces hoynatensis]RKN37770.1 GNAT family N-acetyltransferase [Streptomyces hoynatensis]
MTSGTSIGADAGTGGAAGAGRSRAAFDILTRGFDHPDARRLNDLVQAEYAARYGDEGDVTPLEPGMFAPPRGRYLLAYDAGGRPVASGGWRARNAGPGSEGDDADGGDDGEGDGNYRDGDAEIKRMYVAPEARRAGLARRILALLEEDARRAGRIRMVLETGIAQPEAIALYESSGYLRLPEAEKFGVYRFSRTSRCYAKPL